MKDNIWHAAKTPCHGDPAFTKAPNRVLVGYSRQVLQTVRSADSVSRVMVRAAAFICTVLQCISYCAQSIVQSNFTCHSCMYYRLTAECILNTESLHSLSPKNKQKHFVAGVGDVDYFENLCARKANGELLKVFNLWFCKL